MKQRSTVLMILDLCAMSAIPVLSVIAALMGSSGHRLLMLFALALLIPLLIVEFLAFSILIVRLAVSRAARARFKADLIEPGIESSLAEVDLRVRCLRSLTFGSAAFAAVAMTWFLTLDLSRAVSSASAVAAAIGLILFWGTANAWSILEPHVASMREAWLAEMGDGRWPGDGRTWDPDYASTGAAI